jgi:hypothetical protein
MNKKNKNQEGENLPVVQAQKVDALEALQNEEAIELMNGKLGVKKSGNIIIGTLNVMTRPIGKHLKDRHEKFYQNSKLHLAADIFLLLVIFTLIFIFFGLRNFQPKAQIDLETSAVPAEVVSGQSGVFTINYKNNGKVDIKSTTLSLIFTKNFILQAVSPQNSWSDQTNTFTIGDLPRGAQGSVKITGIPVGAIGTKQTFNYSLNYLLNGQAVNTLGTYAFPLNSSVLSVSFGAPKQVYQGLDFAGNINLKNSSVSDITSEIDLAFVDSPIVIKSISSNQANLVNGVIIINGLKAAQNLPIQYEAAVDAGEGTVPANLEADLNLNGVLAKQAEATTSLNVVDPKFSVAITTDKTAVADEDDVNFKLIFSNKENTIASSASISIVAADPATVIKNLTIANSAKKYKFIGNSINLGNLVPGESGEINFMAHLSRQQISQNQLTGILADVNYLSAGRAIEYQFFSPKIKYLSELQINSQGLYYSAQGDQLGVGPLPPVVDVPTHFWVFWDIKNNGNELQNLTVTADLPANVGWTGQETVLAGVLNHGQIGRKVTWTVDDVAATGGNYRAGFEVELIPTAADFGKVPALISNIKYSATDIFANQQISGTLPNIDANISSDSRASGKGTVIELKVVK